MRDGQAKDWSLPWGSWLRVESGPGSVAYVDHEGRRWPDVRAAFWQGRLGMSGRNHHVRDEQLELVLAALAASYRNGRHQVEHANDIFGGSVLLYRFHRYWMQSVGLIAGGLDDDPFDAQPTAEGGAVIAMLLATRTPDVHGVPIGREAIRIMGRAPGAADARDPERLHAFEKDAARLVNAFVRDALGSTPVVALHYRDPSGVMPMVRTTWSAPFADDGSRDAFFGWLVERVDRWDAWGSIAYRGGGAALTQRFLALLAVGLADRGATRHAAASAAIALPAPR